MTTTIILAVVGAIVAAGMGTLWYNPKSPMGKLHMRYLGFDKLSAAEQQQLMESQKPHMWKLYAGQMALSLLTAGAVVAIVTMSMEGGVPFTQAAGFVAFNWLCFMVPVVGSHILWGNCDRAIAWKKFLSDSFSHLAIVLAIAVLAGLFG